MTNSTETNWSTIPRDGGILCLDFINTVSDRTVAQPRDYLNSFADLVNWLDYTQVLPAEVLGRYRQVLPAGEQEVLLGRARKLRALLARIFDAAAGGRPAPPEALEAFNTFLREPLAHRRVSPGEGRYEWTWEWPEAGTASALLWPILFSAAETLVSDRLNRIKACPACAWLFYDHSKNSSRTWCSMATCGSASKARRYYRRKKNT